MLENAGRFVTPVLPAGASLRPLKAALLRVLRIVTRDQTTFNSALLEALRGALLETEAVLRQISERAEDFAARLAQARARLARSAGKDLHASQRRLDALEKDRDERAEALAREKEESAEEIQGILGKVEEANERLRMLRLDWSSLRSNLQNLSEARPSPAARGQAPASAVRADDPLRAGLYADFEEHFRGSEEDIRAPTGERRGPLPRGARGPSPISDADADEFLEALAAEGVAAIGCDANPVMAARAKEKKLAVDQADLFTWLAARPDSSLGGVTAFQVIEHLPPASLFDLVELAIRKLAPSGRVLFETINPESVYAMRWFWMDLTHVRPVPAPSLAQLLTASGFRDVTVDFRSPVPESEGLPRGLADDPRFAPLSRLLFAPQDYAVTGVK